MASAFHLVFWWFAGFSAVVVLLSLWLAGVQPAPKASPDDALPSEPISGGLEAARSPRYPSVPLGSHTSHPAEGINDGTAHRSLKAAGPGE